MTIFVGERVRVVKTSEKPSKAPPEKLPWPRAASDGTPLGVDVRAKMQDITKIVYKYFRVEDIPMEELIQEVFVAIVHKNYTKSAHDPRKSSFGHYVFMIANNVCRNLVHKKKRYEKERDSIDVPISSSDDRTILDVAESDATIPADCSCDRMRDVEYRMRDAGRWDLARYIRTVRSGASPDVVREALSWKDQRISSKVIRDFRIQIKMAFDSMAVA